MKTSTQHCYASARCPSTERNLEAHQAFRFCTDRTRSTIVRAFHKAKF